MRHCRRERATEWNGHDVINPTPTPPPTETCAKKLQSHTAVFARGDHPRMPRSGGDKKIEGFPKMRYPIHPNTGWFLLGKSHLEMDDDWGYPYFREPPLGSQIYFLSADSWPPLHLQPKTKPLAAVATFQRSRRCWTSKLRSLGWWYNGEADGSWQSSKRV